MLDILPCAPKCGHFTTFITKVNSASWFASCGPSFVRVSNKVYVTLCRSHDVRLLTSSVFCFSKRPAAVSYIVSTGNVARSAPCVLAGAVCYSSIVVDHLPHPLSTRPAVSWSTFLPYLLYHPRGGHAARARADPAQDGALWLHAHTNDAFKKKRSKCRIWNRWTRVFMEHLQPMLINGVSDS